MGCNTFEIPAIKSIFSFPLRVPEKLNPTSQNEKRGLGTQLMATSILGWRMMYLNIIGNSVSDLIIVGQTIFCELDR